MYTAQVMTALGIVTCYIMGRSLAWNWLSLGALIFLVPFTFGLYYIPESPPWLVYNDEEDLAFKSMSQIRGEEYDATCEIEHFKVNPTTLVHLLFRKVNKVTREEGLILE